MVMHFLLSYFSLWCCLLPLHVEISPPAGVGPQEDIGGGTGSVVPRATLEPVLPGWSSGFATSLLCDLEQVLCAGGYDV